MQKKSLTIYFSFVYYRYGKGKYQEVLKMKKYMQYAYDRFINRMKIKEIALKYGVSEHSVYMGLRVAYKVFNGYSGDYYFYPCLSFKNITPEILEKIKNIKKGVE